METIFTELYYNVWEKYVYWQTSTDCILSVNEFLCYTQMSSVLVLLKRINTVHFLERLKTHIVWIKVKVKQTDVKRSFYNITLLSNLNESPEQLKINLVLGNFFFKLFLAKFPT